MVTGVRKNQRMRIAVLTPGTGSFHCGTCLRDQALARELRTLGHDVLFVPLYLPPTLDTADENTSAVFLGGINVYLQHHLAFFRKTPRWLDRIFDAPFVLGRAAKQAGMTQAKDLGPITLTMLQGENGNQVKELERLAQWLRDDIQPDVVLLSNILLVGLALRLKSITGAKVWCTLHGEDTFLDALPPNYRLLCWNEVVTRSSHVDGFIAVSQTYKDVMVSRAKLSPERVFVVHNGVDTDTYTPVTTLPKAPVIGYLARQCFGKGLHSLVDAFINIRKHLPGARLIVAGTRIDSDIPYIDGIKARLRASGDYDAVTFYDNVTLSEKIALLQQMRVLSVPALYGESFGLYVIEGLSCGVPLVQPQSGAFPELAAATGGIELFDQSRSGEYEKALLEVLMNKAEVLGTRGRQAVLKGFSTKSMAMGVVDAFSSIGV